MKPKIHLVEEPSRAEVNRQLAVTQVRLYRMKQHHKPGAQKDRAAEHLEEFAGGWAEDKSGVTLNTHMAQVLAGRTTRRWWQIWRRG